MTKPEFIEAISKLNDTELTEHIEKLEEKVNTGKYKETNEDVLEPLFMLKDELKKRKVRQRNTRA